MKRIVTIAGRELELPEDSDDFDLKLLQTVNKLLDGSARAEDLAFFVLVMNLDGSEAAIAIFKTQMFLVDAILELAVRASRTGADRQDAVAALHKLLDERLAGVVANVHRGGASSSLAWVGKPGGDT